MSDGLPQPGWYRDPRGEADLRWWDGHGWTAQTAAMPPAPPPGPAPAPTPFGRPAVPGSAGIPSAPKVTAPSAPGEQPSIRIGDVDRPLAPWGRRAVAFILDGLIKFAFTIPAIAIAIVIAATIDWGAIDFQKLQDGDAGTGEIPGLTAADTARLGGALLVLLAWSLVVELTYQPMTMARGGVNNGRTWGMQALGIRVVRDNGEPMSYGPALVREFLVMGVLFGLVSGIGNAVTVIGGTVVVLVFYLWPLWDSQNRAVQDFICSTHVVAD